MEYEIQNITKDLGHFGVMFRPSDTVIFDIKFGSASQ